MAPKPDATPEENAEEGGGLIQSVTKTFASPAGKAIAGVLVMWGVALYFMHRKR